MTQRPWPVLTRLQRLAESGDHHLIEAGLYDAIADRLEQALASGTNEALRDAASALEVTFHQFAKTAPESVREAIRGAPQADPSVLAAFWAGQSAFAQGFAARAIGRRADDRFASRIIDVRYERYVRTLLARAMSGEELARVTGERKETVSRKLATLAGLGIVERRRQGNHVINVLSPAARAFLKHRNIGVLGGNRQPTISASVASALESRSRGMPGHMLHSPVLGAKG